MLMQTRSIWCQTEAEGEPDSQNIGVTGMPVLLLPLTILHSLTWAMSLTLDDIKRHLFFQLLFTNTLKK
jgi:hypothetical protein